MGDGYSQTPKFQREAMIVVLHSAMIVVVPWMQQEVKVRRPLIKFVWVPSDAGTIRSVDRNTQGVRPHATGSIEAGGPTRRCASSMLSRAGLIREMSNTRAPRSTGGRGRPADVGNGVECARRQPPVSRGRRVGQLGNQVREGARIERVGWNAARRQ